MWDELGIKYIKGDKFKTCVANGKLVLQSVEQGKEYYLSRHAAIVRKNEDDVLQYLELQSSRCGWKNFYSDIGQTLKDRFSCSSYHGAAYLTDISQCEGNDDFIHILGYLNTAEDMQKKGVGGYAK